MTTKVTTTGSARPNGEGMSDGHSVSIEDAAHSLKEGIVHSLSGLSMIETDIASLVRKTVADVLRTGGSTAGELVNVVHHVVMGTIGAAEQVGTGLTMSIKSVAKGIVMGVHDVGGDVVVASAEIMRSVVKHAAAVGSDMGVVAKRAVDGVIEATVDTGGNVAQVGKSAIEGAIEEAGAISNIAVKTLKDVLGGIVGSLGESLGAQPQEAPRSGATKKQQAGASGKAMSH